MTVFQFQSYQIPVHKEGLRPVIAADKPAYFHRFDSFGTDDYEPIAIVEYLSGHIGVCNVTALRFIDNQEETRIRQVTTKREKELKEKQSEFYAQR